VSQRPPEQPLFGRRLPEWGTVAQNAERLSKDFARLAEDPWPIIVFAYSKELPDVLDMTLRHP
jgi:hypothetical protein